MAAAVVICPNGHQNPQQHHFCGECGVALPVVCPNGHPNPPGQNLCGECGAAVQAIQANPVAAESRLEQLAAEIDETRRELAAGRVDLPEFRNFMADARPQDEQIATDLAKNDQIESSQALPTERRRDSPNPKASPQQTPEPPTSPTAPHEQLSQAERGSILEDNLLEAGSQGGHVETRSATEAVVVYGRPVNHVLHLLLSVFTCGLWVPVWLFIAATGGQHRATICVDPEGTVSETNAPIGPAKPLLWTAIELWLLCMIVVFSVVVRSCSAAFSDHPVSSSSTTTHTKIPTPTMSMPTGIVPEARDGKFAFVITNITTAPTLTWGVALESESQTAQGNFVIVSMTVGNTSSTEYGFFADDQRLVDTAGSQIKSSFDQSDRTKTFFTTSPSPVYLGPGERVKVDLAFDVAPGQQAKRMVLHDSSLSRGVGVNLPPY